jgi:prevent-host-death family protein
MQISAAKFKAQCLKLMDQVNAHHEEVVITKHGKPVAKLIPFTPEPTRSLFGYMKSSVKIHGDIIKPIEDEWDAER